jgi:serine/threonine protein kinase
MAAPGSADDLVDLVRQSRLVDETRLGSFLARGPLPSDPESLTSDLVASGVLTAFQARYLLAGKHRSLVLGTYRILTPIGQGGVGVVYLAEHLTLHRKVAIKLLHGTAGQDDLAQGRFSREARLAAALDHPNIVRIYDFSQVGKRPYIVMEYVEGQTLRSRLEERGPIPFVEAVGYLVQVARGLQHAHEKGLVHRDIKPENLILDKNGVVKILDMGLARPVAGEHLTQQLDPQAILGSADYLAPEQALTGNVDIRADIYSLGATFFALVVGRAPFRGPTAQKLMHHQLVDPPQLSRLRRDIPQELSRVIARMLAKRPSDRYETPAEVIEALSPWLPERQTTDTRVMSRDPVTVVPEKTARQKGGRSGRAGSRRYNRAAAGVRRTRVVVAAGIAAAVGLLVLLAVGGWWTFRRAVSRAPAPAALAEPERTPVPPQPDPRKQRGLFRPLPLDKVATASSARSLFNGEGHPFAASTPSGEKLVFADWGPKTFDEVPFHLIDPQENHRLNVIVLRGGPRDSRASTMPTEVTLPCNSAARAIHLLGGISGWGFPVGRYGSDSLIVRLRYADGETEEHTLCNGVHLADYIKRFDVPESQFACTLEHGQQIRYLSILPKRSDSIQEIQFIKGSDGTAPVILAVTVEAPRAPL